MEKPLYVIIHNHFDSGRRRKLSMEKPLYVIIHTHRFGVNAYIVKSSVPVSDRTAKRFLGEAYEDDRADEFVEVDGPYAVHDLIDLSSAALIAEDEDDDDDDNDDDDEGDDEEDDVC
jgi:hypothetical protein